MEAGVPKSGSPAPKSITSTPSRRRRSTVAVTFMVGELAIRVVRSANGVVIASLGASLCAGSSSAASWRPSLLDAGHLLAKTLLHYVGNEAVHAAAEREYFFDQPGADVAVLLG